MSESFEQYMHCQARIQIQTMWKSILGTLKAILVLVFISEEGRLWVMTQYSERT